MAISRSRAAGGLRRGRGVRGGSDGRGRRGGGLGGGGGRGRGERRGGVGRGRGLTAVFGLVVRVGPVGPVQEGRQRARHAVGQRVVRRVGPVRRVGRVRRVGWVRVGRVRERRERLPRARLLLSRDAVSLLLLALFAFSATKTTNSVSLLVFIFHAKSNFIFKYTKKTGFF